MSAIDLWGGTPPDWWDEARCRAVEGINFFPSRGESNVEARACCELCPVRADCLEHALTRPEHFGVWGGLSERERRRLRRKRRASRRRTSAHLLQPCGTPAAYRRHLDRGETPCQSCREAWASRAAENAS